jgi:4-hydroxy-3-polyprenylbenzoate decarboxylase
LALAPIGGISILSNQGENSMRMIVGITGASGVILGVRLLQELRRHEQCEVHLIVTQNAKLTLKFETDIAEAELLSLADFYYDERNLAALIASGSFVTDGMIVVPCSMKTLSAISVGYAENLLVRAVDVCLKENRRVVLVPREMPFGKIHLKNMYRAADLGCTIIPPMLTFYNAPRTIEDEISHVVGKVLLQFGITPHSFHPWKGEIWNE